MPTLHRHIEEDGNGLYISTESGIYRPDFDYRKATPAHRAIREERETVSRRWGDLSGTLPPIHVGDVVECELTATGLVVAHHDVDGSFMYLNWSDETLPVD